MTNEMDLAKEMGDRLRTRGLYLVTAESCSGGLLSHWVTSVPGSSGYFLGGVVAYDNWAKTLWLAVKTETLSQHGAVSRETTLEMARGARSAFQGKFAAETILTAAISGIAGLAGGTPEKPVGTVWIAVSGSQKEGANCYHFQGSREEIKAHSARQALNDLLFYLRD